MGIVFALGLLLYAGLLLYSKIFPADISRLLSLQIVLLNDRKFQLLFVVNEVPVCFSPF